MVLKRIALAVEYDGALSEIAQEAITIHCAGRTDTGVHAAGQVVHFDSSVERPLRAWTFGANSHLDRRIAIHWAAEMPEDFHARFSAIDRSYRYTILNRSTRPGYQAGTLGWERVPLDAQKMHTAAQVLLGEHDFSSFRSAECQANHAIRLMKRVAVKREQDRIVVEVTANGFLHNMVRILTGCLLAIGRGDRPDNWMATLLEAKDRTKAGMTIAPHGLCFIQPSYPAHYGVPDFENIRTDPWHP